MLKQINSFSYGVFVILISTGTSRGKCRLERGGGVVFMVLELLIRFLVRMHFFICNYFHFIGFLTCKSAVFLISGESTRYMVCLPGLIRYPAQKTDFPCPNPTSASAAVPVSKH